MENDKAAKYLIGKTMMLVCARSASSPATIGISQGHFQMFSTIE
jgi:hypothetical protein